MGAKHSKRRSTKSGKAQDPKLEEEREEEDQDDKQEDKPEEQQEKREEQDVKQEDHDETQEQEGKQEEEEEVREEQSGEGTEEPPQNHTEETEEEGVDEEVEGEDNEHLQVTTFPLVQPVPRAVEEFVGLNVGGVVYRTSRSTLVRYPDSLLGVIFTASVPTPKDNQGNYMIDGDGQMFRHILNYLRRDALCLPKNFQEHRLLEQEAAFYQLPELQDLVTEILKQTPSGGTLSQTPTGTTANPQVGIPTETVARILSNIPAEPTKETSKYVIEVYVCEEDDRPQSWRIYGGDNFLQKIPTLTDYIHAYRKGSQCLEFTTQHPMFPINVYKRFPKTNLFYHIFNLGFKLHTSDCIEITDENNYKTPWLRYLFIFTE